MKRIKAIFNMHRLRLFEIIEKSEEGDRESWLYDIFMLMCIAISIVPLMHKGTTPYLRHVEIVVTYIFVIDYLFRLLTADFKVKRGKLSFLLYPFTPMAILDILSILPSLVLLDSDLASIEMLVMFRSLRILRVIRVFKILRYSRNTSMIMNVFKRQKDPLMVVGGLVVGYVLVVALIMFNVEPYTFDTFFDAVYWSVVSLTTIGYGDIFAQSLLGKVITVLSALMGVAVFALPAGIITAGYMEELSREKDFRLIAMDMDGTLLNSKKELTPAIINSMQRAADEGKELVIATGRSLMEVLPYAEQLPMVHYGLLSSATIIFDFWEQKVISMDYIPWDNIDTISKAYQEEDIMIVLMCEGVALVDRNKYEHIEDYHMEQYRELYQTTATLVDEPLLILINPNQRFEKINLYHKDKKARNRTKARLGDIPLEIVDGEETGIELTPLGISKGVGLRKVCRLIDIPINKTIAVGDADNDISMLENAGMGIAMKNANKKVKEFAEVVVADNDHDGCKQAIEKYLLGE